MYMSKWCIDIAKWHLCGDLNSMVHSVTSQPARLDPGTGDSNCPIF